MLQQKDNTLARGDRFFSPLRQRLRSQQVGQGKSAQTTDCQEGPAIQRSVWEKGKHEACRQTNDNGLMTSNRYRGGKSDDSGSGRDLSNYNRGSHVAGTIVTFDRECVASLPGGPATGGTDCNTTQLLEFWQAAVSGKWNDLNHTG
jgi:hypothetical protein